MKAAMMSQLIERWVAAGFGSTAAMGGAGEVGRGATVGDRAGEVDRAAGAASSAGSIRIDRGARRSKSSSSVPTEPWCGSGKAPRPAAPAAD